MRNVCFGEIIKTRLQYKAQLFNTMSVHDSEMDEHDFECSNTPPVITASAKKKSSFRLFAQKIKKEISNIVSF